MKQTSFKEAMKDPAGKKLIQQGKALEFITLMDIKESEVRIEKENYTRSKANVKKDASFLKDAMENLQGGSAVGRPAELEKKDPKYIEMIKQVDAAKQKAEQGIPLTADENKAMVTAIKKYVDGGTKTAGGVKKAPHFKEAMCVLKEFMPPQDFKRYCNQINEAHPKRTIDPESFTRERMTGKAKTAQEFRDEAKRQFRLGFSEDACATVLAIKNLSKGNPNAFVDPKALEAEKAKLMKGGSAFRRAMQNDKDREVFKNLASEGKMVNLGKALEISSKYHAVGAMQWQINRNIRILTSESRVTMDTASKNLASIIVAHNQAKSGGAGSKLTEDEFATERIRIEQDPSFRKLAERYATEPDFKKMVDKNLSLDNSGSLLAEEYDKIRQPEKVNFKPAKDPEINDNLNKNAEVARQNPQQKAPQQPVL